MKALTQCPLFKDIPYEEINKLVGEGFGIRQFKENEIIVSQGSVYSTLLIIIEGEIVGEMNDFSGKTVVIETINAPNLIAPAILYCEQNKIPVNVVAKTYVKVLPISREDLSHILQSNIKVLNNFLRLISERSKFLSDKVRLLRFGTIKSKFSGYLLELYSRKQSLNFTIEHSQQELADMFGVSRPALAKTIGQMIDEGLIWSSNKEYKILNLKELNIIYRDNS
ncbi:MAG: Crp/Fnr family transcriptional regulator [Bacteroidales bacterium]